MSTRTLSRRFRDQTGTTPVRWLQRSRIRRAQYLLETTGHSVKRIALLVGFGSPTSFRDLFKRLVGITRNPTGARSRVHQQAEQTIAYVEHTMSAGRRFLPSYGEVSAARGARN